MTLPRALHPWTLALAALFPLVTGCPGAGEEDDDDATADDDSTPPPDDDATADDDSTPPPDDDATPDDDSTPPPDDDTTAPPDDDSTPPPDDDTTGDDDATPAPSDCPAPFGRSIHPIGPDRVFSVTAASPDGAWDGAPGAVFESVLANDGGVALDATWNNCGHPTFSLADAATGSVLWSRSESDDILCLVPGTIHLEPGDEAVFTLAYDGPELTAGQYLLTARSELQFGPPGGGGPTLAGPAGGPGLPMFDFHVTVGQAVAGGAVACSPGTASAGFRNGVRIDLEAAPPGLPLGDPLAVSGSGVSETADLDLTWDQCGYPEFYATERGAEDWLWSWSMGYVADCAPIDGWPMGEVRADSTEVDAGTFGEGTYTLGVRFTGRPPTGGDVEVYALESGFAVY